MIHFNITPQILHVARAVFTSECPITTLYAFLISPICYMVFPSEPLTNLAPKLSGQSDLHKITIEMGLYKCRYIT